MEITLSERRDLPREEVLALYRSNGWSSADKPEELMAALAGSHSVVTAWAGARLLGLGNAISDGHLVVYYPHLLVHPDCRGQGVGRRIMARMTEKYRGFHQHMLTAVEDAVGFYERCGFVRAARNEAMWIYDGDDV